MTDESPSDDGLKRSNALLWEAAANPSDLERIGRLAVEWRRKVRFGAETFAEYDAALAQLRNACAAYIQQEKP